jgi:hypothetical protein
MNDWIQVKVIRNGAPVAGAPFTVKLRYRRLHVEPQIAPISAKTPVQVFLIFQDVNACVLVGDFVELPHGNLTKIIDVRTYPFSLQCILQRLPYWTMPIWLPKSASSSLLSDSSLPDMTYVAGGSVMANIEPHGLDQQGPLPIGMVDRRPGWIYSLQPLQTLSVLLNDRDYWLIISSSSVWQITKDYRAPARRLLNPPLGV